MPAYGQSLWGENAQGVENVGDSVSRVMLARMAGQQRARQWMAQQALEQQYLGLAKQKEARAGAMDQMQMSHMGLEAVRQSGLLQQEQQERQARQTMGQSVRSAYLTDPNQSMAETGMLNEDSPDRVAQADAAKASVLTARDPQQAMLTARAAADPHVATLLGAGRLGMQEQVLQERTQTDEKKAAFQQQKAAQEYAVKQQQLELAKQHADVYGKMLNLHEDEFKNRIEHQEDSNALNFIRTAGVTATHWDPKAAMDAYEQVLGKKFSLHNGPTAPSASGSQEASGKVKMRNKDGVVGYVPAEQHDAALKEGFTDAD